MVFPFIDTKWDPRIDQNSIYTWFTTPELRKDGILNPKKERDFLMNLYFSQPDWKEVDKKMYYSTFFGAKAGIVIVWLFSFSIPLQIFVLFLFLALCWTAVEISACGTRNKKVALQLAAKSFAFIGMSYDSNWISYKFC